MNNEPLPETKPTPNVVDVIVTELNPAPIKAAEQIIPHHFTKPLLSIATNAWKLRSRLVDVKTGEPRDDIKKEDIRKLVRQIESIFEAFGQMDLEVKDRTGEPFDYGLPEKVVTTQPQAGLKREQIIETLRPSIYWNKQLAQQGEVVIATPA